MPAKLHLSDIFDVKRYRQFRVARDIQRMAKDKLRQQDKWRNGVYALDTPTGTAIVFARGIGGDVLELHEIIDGQVAITPIDVGSMTRSSKKVLVSALATLAGMPALLELRAYDYASRTVGPRISGPPTD